MEFHADVARGAERFLEVLEHAAEALRVDRGRAASDVKRGDAGASGLFAKGRGL